MEWYRQQGREMPTSPIISTEQMTAIQEEWPEINRMRTELIALQFVRYNLFQQIQNARYGVK